MAALDRLVGSDVVITFTPDGGSPITMSGDYTAAKVNRSVRTVDVTAGNEKQSTNKGTIEDMDFNITIFDADQAYLSQILPDTYGVMNIKKTGVGSGKPELEFNCLLTEYNEDYTFDAALEIEISGMRNGAMIKEVGATQS